MIGEINLDPVGFVATELALRGALVEPGDASALAVLPAGLASQLSLPEAVALGPAPADGAVSCGLGSPLLDRLVTEVRTSLPVASVSWSAEPPRLAVAERLAERLLIRNGVANVLGVSHASATYLAGVFSWTAEADDRYQGLSLIVAHASNGAAPDASATAAIAALIDGRDDRASDQHDARTAIGGAAFLAKRAALTVGPRLDEIVAAVARRRDRERARIDDYFSSLVGEARLPRRQVARQAIGARVAALEAEHAAKLRDLSTRYTLRVRIEPIALVSVTMRIAEIRMRLRRRKGERELELQLPPAARLPDALACVACANTTREPLLCDDALHVLCGSCAPEATGRPQCPACRTPRQVGTAHVDANNAPIGQR
jgi:hypothetical protein